MNKSKSEYKNSVKFILANKTMQEAGVLLDLKHKSIPKIDNVFYFYKDFSQSVLTVSVVIEHSEKIFDIIYASNGSVEYNIIKKNDKYIHEMNFLLEAINSHFFGFFLLCNRKLTFRDKKFKPGEIINVCFLPFDILDSEKQYRRPNMLADIRFVGIKDVYICPEIGQKVCVIHKKETKIRKVKDHFYIKEDQRFENNNINCLVLNFERQNVINFCIDCDTSDIETEIIFPEKTKNKYNSEESPTIELSSDDSPFNAVVFLGANFEFYIKQKVSKFVPISATSGVRVSYLYKKNDSYFSKIFLNSSTNNVVKINKEDGYLSLST